MAQLLSICGFSCILFANEPVPGNKNIVTLTRVENNKANLMATKILEEAYRRIGYKVNTVALPAERSISMANSGEFDGLVVRTNLLEKKLKKKYPNLVMVPAKVSYLDLSVYSKDLSLTATEMADLKHKTVGVLLGNKWLSSLTRGFNTVQAPGIESLFLMLDRDRFEVLLFPKIIGSDVINRLGLNNIVINNPSIKQLDIHHYLHKKNVELVPKLSSILEQMEQKNESLNIRKKWVEACLHNSQVNKANCLQ